MNDNVNQFDPFDPVGAYVRPIRSVLFIDDQFPTFEHSDGTVFSEAERAHALWRACTQRGLLCDMDNSPEWASPQRQKRLAACDLLVLDYHLLGEDSGPALTIIQDLARSGAPNMLVVYTKDPKPDAVLLKIASWARGVGHDAHLSDDLDDIETAIEWSDADIIAFLKNKDDWKATLLAACARAGRDLPEDSQCIALLERKLRRDYGAQPSQEIRPIDQIGLDEHRWLQCGNLFVTVVGKPKDMDPEAEAEAFFRKLEDAVRRWNPPWLACLMAHSRHHVEAGAFRDDVLPLDEALQKGLLGYIRDPTSDPPERNRRATEIATHLLSRRSAEAATALGRQLHNRADSEHGEELTQPDVLHLNAFLCSESFGHHHLRVGTIFVHRSSEPQYWVCVTPACDMVPRLPDERLNPWAFELDSFKPMVALRLKILTGASDRKKALTIAHRARHLFFFDQSGNGDQPIVAACFQDTDDPNPRLEQLVAVERALVQEDRSVQLYRCVSKKNELGQASPPVLELITCQPVAQLRAPYAERVVQVVGGHVSRIGVDFVPFKAPK